MYIHVLRSLRDPTAALYLLLIHVLHVHTYGVYTVTCVVVCTYVYVYTAAYTYVYTYTKFYI